MSSQTGPAAAAHEVSTSTARRLAVRAPQRAAGNHAAPQRGLPLRRLPLGRLQSALGNQAITRMLGDDRRAADAAPPSPGRPLEAAARDDMETRFGADLGSVRVRTDPAACDAVGALAYTVGEQIVFNAGAYAPHGQAGRALLAHELTHVLQQRPGGGPSSQARLESEAKRVSRAMASRTEPVAVRERGHVALARAEKPGAPALPQVDYKPMEDGSTELTVDGVTVLRYTTPESGADYKVDVAAKPQAFYFHIARQSAADVSVDWDGVAALESRGFDVRGLIHTESAQLGERIGPSLGGGATFVYQTPHKPPAIPGRSPQTHPAPKPPKNPARDKPPPAEKPPAEKPPVTQSGAGAQADEQALPQPKAVSGPEAGGPAAAPEAAAPEAAAVEAEISAELAEVEPLATTMAADVMANPADHALNTVRGVASRLQADEEFVAALASRGGELSATANAAAARLRVLRTSFAPAVATAERWHTAHPAGESIGMWDERQGTWLAGKYLENWEKGGWNYAAGAADLVGAAGIAAFEGVAQGLSFGFHDAATAVSLAYARGDISWNEGERILSSAAWRSLLTAAVTAAAGGVTGRLGAVAARGLGLAPEAFGSGIVAGGISGGLTSAASLGTQSLSTSALKGEFDSPAARAIWSQGIPSGKEWAIAIPVSVALGAGFGARAVQLRNQELIGSVVPTPGGPCKIIAISGGQMILEPVGGLGPPPPPPPASDIALVYDPVTGKWGTPPGAGSELATVPRTAPPSPAAGAGVVVDPIEPVRGVKATPAVLPPVPETAAPAGDLAKTDAVLPSTPNTAAADLRVAQARGALAAASKATSERQVRVLAAQRDLDAAVELRTEAGRSASGRDLVKEQQAALSVAKAGLRPVSASEELAAADYAKALEDQKQIVVLENEVARLDSEVRQELNPPGGFSREAWNAGRRPGREPAFTLPGASDYYQKAAQLATARAKLAERVQDLTVSLKDQLAATTPGRAARPVALANASSLPDQALRPVNGVPIDVTTGSPMNTADWATDHLMSRTEIAQDPRYARLSPAKRREILTKVRENFLPMTREANSSKGAQTVNEWIAGRPETKRIPDDMAKALRAADKLARDAIEQFFRDNEGK